MVDELARSVPSVNGCQYARVRPFNLELVAEKPPPVDRTSGDDQKEKEPLKQEVGAFIQVCQTGSPATTDGDEGVAVQTVLEQMTNCLQQVNQT